MLQFEISSVLSGHTSVVTFAEGIYCTEKPENPRTLVASASVDSTLKIWERKDVHGLKTLLFRIYHFPILLTITLKYERLHVLWLIYIDRDGLEHGLRF